MAVITSARYLNIARSIANARILILQTQDEWYDAVEFVVLSQVVDVEVDLLYQMWQSYQVSLTDTNPKSYYLSAVSVLQQHVIDRATDGSGDTYTDINEWLRDENTQVPATFAELSESAGWPIDHDRISADPTVTITY